MPRSILALVLVAALARVPLSRADPACVPACGPGFLCHLGACVSECNPPCSAGELCAPGGACVSACNPPCPIGAACDARGECAAPAVVSRPHVPEARATRTDPPRTLAVTVALLGGRSIPIDGLNYNAGVGLRAGVSFHDVYLGAMATLHQGDHMDAGWGSVPGLGIRGGQQSYDSRPLFVAADLGYGLHIDLGPVATLLAPYLSGGVLLFDLETSGAYAGSETLSKKYFVLGGGLSYAVLLGNFTAGIHFRTYNTGDTRFQYGSLSQGRTPHGFSVSIYYAALYLETGYRF